MACKIAMVDSGLDSSVYPHINELIDFTGNEKGESLIEMNDDNGHGTLCVSSLLAANPYAEIIVLKVLDANNRCSSERLLNALEYLTNINVDIINLSLASCNSDHELAYRKVCNKLKSQKKVLISSFANNKSYSLPAELDTVIGVGGKIFDNDDYFEFNLSNKIQCICDKKPLLLKGKDNKYQLFGGNSKATAYFTGILSRSWDRIGNEVENFLSDKTNCLSLMKPSTLSLDEKCSSTGILENLKRYDLVESTSDGYLYEMNGFDISDLITKIEKLFGCRLIYESINYRDFENIESVAAMITHKSKRLNNG